MRKQLIFFAHVINFFLNIKLKGGGVNPKTLPLPTTLLELIQYITMGVGRIFSGGAVRDFPKIFSGGGPKVVKFGFYPSKLKKQPFFANNLKIQGGKAPSAPPSPMYIT